MSDKKPSIFRKYIDASFEYVDLKIEKARNELANKISDIDENIYSKALTDDPSYQVNSMGYKQKENRLIDETLKRIAVSNTILSGLFQTRQNQVSKHSKLVFSDKETGFMLKLKPEEKEKMLSEIKEVLIKEAESAEKESSDGTIADENDKQEAFNWEMERKAKEKLKEAIKDDKAKLETFIQNCGDLEGRPFDKRKWRFDTFLRAIVRDRLTYDKICVEKIKNLSGELSYFFPVDASTIKFASPQLKKYKTFPGAQTNVDLLYPEKQLEALENTDAFELDDEKLENEEYKYVQVFRGRIERAFLSDEMTMAMMNPTTNVYNNGYSISELELMISTVTNHLNAEYYKQSYYTQGFSAKGILHLKAPINRRKLEVIRQQWHHMIKGAKNSWQTPIFAGMDEVKWIPLTQTDDSASFDSWLKYLIKIICSIYQIDPKEIGLGFKDDGGGGLSGDDTAEKLNHSKDKGLYPLIRFIEDFINTEIIEAVDPRFCIEFTGANSESKKDALERQEKEVTFKKTLNEIRAEDNLPPIEGGDEIILNPVYLQWYSTFSKKGQEIAEKANSMEGQGDIEGMDSLFEDGAENTAKSLKVEYYKLK